MKVEALCSPKRRYISHTAYAITSQKTPSAPQTSQPTVRPRRVTATVNFFSIIHEVPGCCHVAACCRHSARNNTAMLPHPAACNLITPLLRLSSRNAKPYAKSQVETSVRAVVAVFRASPPPAPFPSPHPPESVKQYTSTSSVKSSGCRTCRSLSHPKQFYCSPTHCVCVLCVADTISSSHFSAQS